MKTEVYSWRVSPEIRAGLAAEARRRETSVAALLDQLAGAWLQDLKGCSDDDTAVQAELHAEAENLIGVLSGGNPKRAESARSAIRRRLARRHAG